MCVCVSYLRLCINVGAVCNQFLHHVCLTGKRSYVEGRVSFLLKKKSKKSILVTMWQCVYFIRFHPPP